MGVVYRTAGPWGPGLAEDLTPAQVDGNFYQVEQDIAAKAAQGVGISNFVVNGGQMTVVLTDHSLLGPYPLPLATLSFRGEWMPDTGYLANDIITANGATYMVLENHTSEATFDPGANDGAGQDFYGLLLQAPALHLPDGGGVGQVLTKSGTIDFAAAWVWPTLAGLHDVLPSPAPVSGDLVYWNGSSFSYLPQSTIAEETTFAGLADVSLGAGPFPGQPIIYNGTAYTNTSKVDLPWKNTLTYGPGASIDRANGEIQSLQIAGGPVTLSIINWPATGYFGRLVLRVINGGFLLNWPTSVKWPGGTAPVESAAGTNIYIFLSFDGGATYYGNLVGYNYA